MEKILICIDDNALFTEVARKAILLARGLNAQLSVIYVIDNRHGPDSEIIEREDEARRLVQKILDRFNCSALIYIEAGKPKERIMKKARDLEVDLIVMGNESDGNKKQAGTSVTDQVVKCSKIPVMLIPY